MMKRLLPLGGLLLCVSACAESGPVDDRGSFFDPGTGEDDEMDGGALDAGEADPDPRRDGGRPERDAATPRPDGGSSLPDAATDPADAAVEADAGLTDAGTGMDATTPDAGGDDAGDADAGLADAGGADAAAPEDDAGQPEPDAGTSCGTEGLVAGNSCAGVVTCQDNNFSGNPVLECVLFESGARQQHCCTALFASSSCRTSACGANDDEAGCDGPEDCAGSACCFNGGATACGTSCGAPDTLCHADADCPSGTHCEVGNAAGRYEWWGFCRG